MKKIARRDFVKGAAAGTVVAGAGVLAGFQSAFSASTARAPATVQKEARAEYTVLNPRADLPDYEAKPLAPRLATLAGKTVFVTSKEEGGAPLGRGTAIEIARALPKAVPGVKVVYEKSTLRGEEPAEPPLFTIGTQQWAQKNADAVISVLGY